MATPFPNFILEGLERPAVRVGVGLDGAGVHWV